MSRRVGWWGLGPFIYGLFFTVFGVLMLAGSGAVGPGASGLVISGVVFLVIGIGALALAWYIRRDILGDDDSKPAKPAPSAADARTAAQLDAQLRVTGAPGQAVIKGFSYVAGSSQGGTTTVELNLDVTTNLGGTLSVQRQERVPVSVTDQLQAGATVPVIVSSTDPSQMVIEWTGLTPPQSAPPESAPTKK